MQYNDMIPTNAFSAIGAMFGGDVSAPCRSVSARPAHLF